MAMSSTRLTSANVRLVIQFKFHMYSGRNFSKFKNSHLHLSVSLSFKPEKAFFFFSFFYLPSLSARRKQIYSLSLYGTHFHSLHPPSIALAFGFSVPVFGTFLKPNLALMEHYERHCPPPERRYNCMVPPPFGYKVGDLRYSCRSFILDWVFDSDKIVTRVSDPYKMGSK
jgi:hypothetical protein